MVFLTVDIAICGFPRVPSSSSSCSIGAELLQPWPAHWPHIVEHDRPLLWHSQFLSHPDLQLHVMRCRMFSGAGSFSVVTGRRELFSSLQPQSVDGKVIPRHCCSWWKRRKECYVAAADVGGSVAKLKLPWMGCLPMIFMYILCLAIPNCQLVLHT